MISVVTVTWNAGDVIRPTLESVASQTFRDFEHIIADGASTDGTLETVRAFCGGNTRVCSEPDRGIYDAMNKGLRLAKGKYVVFLNAGDSFHSSDVLEKYARAAEKDPDVIYADTVIVDGERHLLGPRHLSVPEHLTWKSFSRGMLVCHQAFMVRRSLAPEYDTTYRFSADYDWTVRILENTDASKCCNLHCVVIDYLADGTTDKNKRASLRERFNIMSRHYGAVLTVGRHISFVFRAVRRKLFPKKLQ